MGRNLSVAWNITWRYVPRETTECALGVLLRAPLLQLSYSRFGFAPMFFDLRRRVHEEADARVIGRLRVIPSCNESVHEALILPP